MRNENFIEGLTNHIQDLTKKAVPIPHMEILNKLLSQIEPIDYKLLAFPQINEIRKRLKTLGAIKNEALKTVCLENEIEVNTDEDDPNSEGISNELAKLKILKLNNKHFLVLSIENALKVAKRNQWGLCKNHDFIYLFNGTYWNEIDKEIFQKFLGEASEKMGVEMFSAKYYQFREQLFKQFLATAYLPTPEQDNDTVLINLQNGTFEINERGTKIRTFDYHDFLTYQLPFEYNQQARAPIFKKYLDKVLPDKDSQKVLAEYLGFVFIKHGSNRLKEEKALILYGTGANGKSVFFEIVNALLGYNNTSSFSLQSLTNDNGYYRAKLGNKLVNYGSEINGKLETSIFKQLVSGEPVEARLPYGQPFILKQYAKLIFNVNELPKDVEHTNAYFRRFLIIPFNVTIPESEQDKTLHTKIIETELSGVFNWVLDGLNRLLTQQRFSYCDAAQKALEQYKTESNSIKLFLDELGYEKSPDKYELIKTIYPEYRLFCIDDGMAPFKKSNFIKQLRALNFIIDRQPGTGQMIVYVTQK